MFHTAKAKLAAILVGLGGANGAGMLTLKEDLLTSLTNWELKDFFGVQGNSSVSSALRLDPSARTHLSAVNLSDSLASPYLNLYSEGSLELGDLGYLLGFSRRIYEIREASNLEIEQLHQLRELAKETQNIKKQITVEDTKLFFSAVKKIEDYAKGQTGVEALTQEERQSVEKYYKIWSDLKGKSIDITRLFKQDQEGTLTRWDTQTNFKKYSEVKSQLLKLKWEGPSMKVLGSTNKFVDGSDSWTSCGKNPHQCPYFGTHKSDSSNWGYTQSWGQNPWKEFFKDEEEWKKFWQERFELKKKYFDEWQVSRHAWEWDNGQFCTVNGVEYFEGCYRSTTQAGLSNVINKANAKISLHTGMRVLLWMGYPLEGELPKSVVGDKSTVKAS
ncbi:hypothetical protein MHLP_03400 [Candidatus Mycoplasma haematolamae str. Purdue]|uniref:Uncharacterized protein n=1 Tax=Mycoplasma haematolamae (strain Purdue) TaxID=1212765 RepID=I7BAD7_MYCHA|nr:hypothetical protein [Candidatus Mycoplasma haematolamae]AFO52260.1 hypothetical protein MHLP_03400 [Candidatus Mycoplasma haematolamae str. Purdue]